MEPTLFRFIWKFSKRQQLMVLLLVAASQPFYYYSLDLPKNIINHLTQASKAMAEGKEVFRSVFDYSFDAYTYLALLTSAFLALVIINGGFKYYINVYKGRLGERMLRRLRYVLYEHLLRFPLGYFSRTAPGEVIPIITSETQPVGEFIGDSIAAPAVAGGMLLNTLFFIVVQDPLLALAAVALYPVQMYLIPKLQTKVNQLTRQRTRMIRSMSDRVNETAVSLQEINAHGVARYALAEFSGRLAANYYLRFRIFKLKFFIKFLNNFIAQLTPFFFFSIGGYFVMRGYMSIGALVAVYAAFKEMAPNWRELLDYYQQLKDAEIRYEQIVEQFVPPGMISQERQHGSYDGADTLETELVATGASWINDAGLKTIDGVSLAIKPREHVAVVGPEGGGKHELGLMLSGLGEVSSGSVTLGGVDVATLPRGLIARRIGYVTQSTQIFSGSFLDNLVVGLQVRPNPAEPEDRAAMARRKAEAIEAEITGNSSDDIECDWIDYAAAGAETRQQLQDRILACLQATDLTTDLRELGLRGTIDPLERPEIAKVILEARAALREHLSAPSLRGYFEMFDKDRFNDQASIAENVLFGT
ncbi:MAG: ABC transporter ATP-binding protein, partial [Alphaproteobacteria bacterium]|nr:ABC transporter ATP-binding protein [Alphaproteobacteria bacterium]